MHKVNLDVIKPWITDRLTQILKFEDDVVIDFCFNLLEKKQVCLTISTADKCTFTRMML